MSGKPDGFPLLFSTVPHSVVNLKGDSMDIKTEDAIRHLSEALGSPFRAQNQKEAIATRMRDLLSHYGLSMKNSK